jgi:hypothetical protein
MNTCPDYDRILEITVEPDAHLLLLERQVIAAERQAAAAERQADAAEQANDFRRLELLERLQGLGCSEYTTPAMVREGRAAEAAQAALFQRLVGLAEYPERTAIRTRIWSERLEKAEQRDKEWVEHEARLQR